MQPHPPREPFFNLPTTTLALVGLILVIHGVREWLLQEDVNFWIAVDWGFVPLRLPLLWGPEAAADELRQALDGVTRPPTSGAAAMRWLIIDHILKDGSGRPFTLLTHAALHGGWPHAIVNSLWLVAFGGAVDRRFGAGRYLLLGLISAAAGALAHMAIDPRSPIPLIGASGAISGYTGAMARFAFATGGPLGRWRAPGDDAFRYPAPPLVDFFRNRRALTFVALWFALNFITGAAALPFEGVEESIAWVAHIGGFAAGFLLFGLFDPVGRLPSATLH